MLFLYACTELAEVQKKSTLCLECLGAGRSLLGNGRSLVEGVKTPIVAGVGARAVSARSPHFAGALSLRRLLRLPR